MFQLPGSRLYIGDLGCGLKIGTLDIRKSRFEIED
jgi:hypothetical protein